jgi:hypothetical protein
MPELNQEQSTPPAYGLRIHFRLSVTDTKVHRLKLGGIVFFEPESEATKLRESSRLHAKPMESQCTLDGVHTGPGHDALV